MRIRTANILYGTAEMNKVRNVSGGELEWEKDLSNNSPLFWRFLQRILANLVYQNDPGAPEITEENVDHILECKELITFIFATVYHTRSNLPRLTEENINAVRAQNPNTEGLVISARCLIESISGKWFAFFRRICEARNLSAIDEYWLYALIKTLLVEIAEKSNLERINAATKPSITVIAEEKYKFTLFSN